MSAPPPRPPGMPPMPPGMAARASGMPPMPPGFRPLPATGAGAVQEGALVPPVPPGMKRPMPPLPPGMRPPGQGVPPPPHAGLGGPPALDSNRYLLPPGGPQQHQLPPPPLHTQMGSGPSPYNAPPPSGGPRYLSPPGHQPPSQQYGSTYPAPPPPHPQGGRYEDNDRYPPYGRGSGDSRRGNRYEDDRGYDRQRHDGGRYDDRGYEDRRHGGGGRYDDRGNNDRRQGGGRYEDRGRRGGGGRSDDQQLHVPLRDPTNTVWVGNLDPVEHSEGALREAFREFGKVMRVASKAGQSYCFVHFRRVEEARNAVETLTQRGTLGRARFNYGKMFEYTQEEMDAPYDPNVREPIQEHGGGRTRGRDGAEHDGFGDDGRPPARRQRQEREPPEPSNILWVGSLPPIISREKLREIFEVFGEVKDVKLMDKGGMAFVHFDSIETCTMALRSMTGRSIEGGVVLALNYGHEQRTAPRTTVELTEDGIPVNENPTNVIYLGQLPSDLEESDLDELFASFEGFISSKYVANNDIGFGHFETVEQARVARVALNSATLKGVPIRVSFGKSNHNIPVGDRNGNNNADGTGEEFNLDAMMRGPGDLDSVPHGALVLSAGGVGIGGMGGPGALVLPVRGGPAGAGAGAASGVTASVFDKERAAPELTLDARLQSLLGITYNNCGAKDLEISPSQIQSICFVVDACVDEASEQRLDDTLLLYSPLKSVHVFNVVAKRMREYFNDDPHKKLLILYAATRVLLGAQTEYNRFTSSALNAYLMVLLMASEGQTSSGADRLTALVESLEKHPFLKTKANVAEEYVAEFKAQLGEILSRTRAEQDLTSLLTKRRRR